MTEITEAAQRGRKFTQVLEGAMRVFMKHGFEGASVDMIASEAGVSKATLYSYFPDKRVMFKEVVLREIDRDRSTAVNEIVAELPMRDALFLAGYHIVWHMLSDFGIRTFRLCLAEAERFPSLAEDYYSKGLTKTHEIIANYLDLYQQRGEMRSDIGDLSFVADTFFRLATTRIHERALFLGPSAIDDEMVERSIRQAVDIFVAAFGTERASKAA